jgi:hypothetical protein
MSRFWPTVAYAEDQPYSKSILTTHVLYRGLQTGSLIGAILSVGRHTLSKRSSASLQTATSKLSAFPRPLSANIIRAAGSGSLAGTVFLAFALGGRMYDKEGIEWQDRSWRLLANKGQVEVDDWSLIGSLAGATVGLGNPALRALGWRGIAGSFGIGSLAGTAGYMVYRHGIKGGKWDEV